MGIGKDKSARKHGAPEHRQLGVDGPQMRPIEPRSLATSLEKRKTAYLLSMAEAVDGSMMEAPV